MIWLPDADVDVPGLRPPLSGCLFSEIPLHGQCFYGQGKLRCAQYGQTEAAVVN
jgi:hypothetical protein